MKQLSGRLFLIVILAFFIACGESRPKIESPHVYSKNGLEFKYPGNWKVSEDTQEDGVHSLIVEATAESMTFIQVYPVKIDMEIKEFANIFREGFTEAVKAETKLAKIKKTNIGKVKEQGGYQTLKETFALSILSEELAHTRIYRRKPVGAQVCFIITQAADEELKIVKQGFAQITESLSCGTGKK